MVMREKKKRERKVTIFVIGFSFVKRGERETKHRKHDQHSAIVISVLDFY